MKKRIMTLLTVIMLSLTICNTVSVFVKAEALPAVIEQNYNKMNNISDYGGEFVVDYVSESWDYETVENILNEVRELSDEICGGYSTDYDKIRAMANYVSENTAYDFDAAHNAVTFDVISLENVLEKKRTTCAGFSNLFSSLCNAQGYYCVNIRGSAASNEDGVYQDSLDDENTVMNHEWTAVYYEGRWLYVDCTWNCTNTYQNGSFYYGSGAVDKYFDISVEELSIDHKAIRVDHRDFFDALSVLTPPETSEEKQQTVENKTVEQADDNQQEEESETEIVTTTAESETTITEFSTFSDTIVESSESETSESTEQITEEASEETSEISSETQNESELNVEKRGIGMTFTVIIGLVIVVAIAAVIIFAVTKDK